MWVKENSVCRVCVPILLTPEVFPKALGVFQMSYSIFQVPDLLSPFQVKAGHKEFLGQG